MTHFLTLFRPATHTVGTTALDDKWLHICLSFAVVKKNAGYH